MGVSLLMHMTILGNVMFSIAIITSSPFPVNGPVHYRKAIADYEIPVPQESTLVHQIPGTDHYEALEVNHYDHLNGHHHSHDLPPLPGQINIYGSLTNQSLQVSIQVI